MNSEIRLAYFIADILNQSPTKCLTLRKIYDVVKQRWEIPKEWYEPIPYGQAYDELKRKGLNKRNLSGISTEPKWKNEVRMAKRRLRAWEWLEENGIRGTWCLNAKGQEDIYNYINY